MKIMPRAKIDDNLLWDAKHQTKDGSLLTALHLILKSGRLKASVSRVGVVVAMKQ